MTQMIETGPLCKRLSSRCLHQAEYSISVVAVGAVGSIGIYSLVKDVEESVSVSICTDTS